MDTTTAAQQAGVTVATIRTWCRRNVIAAIKRAGRWTIDAASLIRRIEIGRKGAMEAPIHLSSKRVPGMLVAVGSASTLASAYSNGTPVTLAGKFAGERVYLGHTRQTWDDGVTVETLGRAGETWTHEGMQIAAYHLDLTRLQEAPRLAELVRQVENRRIQRAMDVEARAAAKEHELEHGSEDGA
ncbi:helix-turn-helix domain-containing protein [Actinomadura sp. WMMA1423]|uniref:helix-turn-helix domain-containing protein n=1 Tax=Actinomadura sp. WMMA1423 TaxID=2591108 RepID=UPI001146F7B0|nr:helix-turn-helix domain-containing protein [Actinomadura sp. WMMA1423]